MKQILFAVALGMATIGGLAQAQLTFNPNQVAILRWYQGNQTASFGVGRTPVAVAFDGANIWVANYDDNNVIKLRASDGLVLGTLASARAPTAWLSTALTFGSRTRAATP